MNCSFFFLFLYAVHQVDQIAQIPNISTPLIVSCKGGSELGRYWLICLCTDTKLNTSTQHSITLHNQIARRGWQLELFSLLLRTLFQEEIKNQFSFLLFCLLQLGSTVKNAQSIIFSFDLPMSTMSSIWENILITVCVCTIMIQYQIRTYGMLKIQCTFVAKECSIIKIISDRSKCKCGYFHGINLNYSDFFYRFFKVVVDILQTSVCTTFKTTSQEIKVIINPHTLFQ